MKFDAINDNTSNSNIQNSSSLLNRMNKVKKITQISNINYTSSLSKTEEDFLKISISEYNDLFPRIIQLTEIEFFKILEKYIKISLNPSLLNTNIMNKILGIIKLKYYEPEYYNINRYIQSINNINNFQKYNGTNYIPHCNKKQDPIHPCKEKLYFINNTYLLCMKCKLIYHKNSVLFYCSHCDNEYYTSINNNYNKLQLATWTKYHCNIIINSTMKCSLCKGHLYLNKNNNKLSCLKCEYEIDQNKISWKCIKCKNNFYSEAKVYNPLEYKVIKIAIKQALYEKKEAKPQCVPCCNISKENIMKYKFYHKKDCGGILYQGILNNKKVVVCSKCHLLNYYNYHLWMCPICKERFKLKNNDCVFNNFINNKDKSKNKDKDKDSDIDKLNMVSNYNSELNNNKNIIKGLCGHKHHKSYSKIRKSCPDIPIYSDNNNNINNDDDEVLIDMDNYNTNKEFNSNLQLFDNKLNHINQKDNKKGNTKSEVNLLYKTNNNLLKNYYSNNNNENFILNIMNTKFIYKKTRRPSITSKKDIKSSEKENKISIVQNYNSFEEKGNKKFDLNNINNNINKLEKNPQGESKQKKLIKHIRNNSSFQCMKLIKPMHKIVKTKLNNYSTNNNISNKYQNNIINNYHSNNNINNINIINNNISTNNLNSNLNKISNINQNNNFDSIIKKRRKSYKTKNIKNKILTVLQKGLNNININLNVNVNINSNERRKKEIPKSVSPNQIQKQNTNQNQNNINNNNKSLNKSQNNSMSTKINKINIDSYSIIGQIGEGTFGKIYEVKDGHNNHFAMKKILLNNPNEIIPLKNEYEMRFTLSNYNLNLVKIYGIDIKQLDKTTHGMYVIMEKGMRDWEKEIERRRKINAYYDENELMKILKELVHTLSELQKLKISHRDIKPQNILLFEGGVFKITDFGEAKNIITLNHQDTVNQTIRGTELYMSPILFKALRQNNFYFNKYIEHNAFKSDVYSLGLCFAFAASLNIKCLCDIREINSMDVIKGIIEGYCKNRYSNNFLGVLFDMIELDEKNRYDFIELENKLFW